MDGKEDFGDFESDFSVETLFGRQKSESVRKEKNDESDINMPDLFEHKENPNKRKKKLKSLKIKQEGAKKKCVVVPGLIMQEEAHSFKGFGFKQPTPKASKLKTVDQLLNEDQSKQKGRGV